MTIAILIWSGAAILLALALYNGMYLGVHDTLTNAEKGCVYSFDYLQPNSGIPHRETVKVLEVQNLSDIEIRRLNSRSQYRATDPSFKRGNTLIKTIDTQGNYRQFYAERCVSVHRLPLGFLRFKSKTT